MMTSEILSCFENLNWHLLLHPRSRCYVGGTWQYKTFSSNSKSCKKKWSGEWDPKQSIPPPLPIPPPNLYSLLIYIPSSLSTRTVSHAFALFCMHRAVLGAFWGAALIRPSSNPGPFYIVICNTWCHLPSKHLVNWHFHGNCANCCKVVPWYADGLVQSLGLIMFRNLFVCTAAILHAFWAVVRIQSQSCTILGDTHPRKRITTLRFYQNFCKRLQKLREHFPKPSR